jgi:ubiquinone/menaquinone biosynthesis C-methylase UbiE
MLTYDEINNIKKLYHNKKNIMEFFRKKNKSLVNSSDAILYSYDLQSGTYYANRNLDSSRDRKRNADLIHNYISKYSAKSILEAGCGEGNTLVPVVNHSNKSKFNFYGFDISLSRLLYAQKYLNKIKKSNIKLFTSEMEHIPLPDNSIDLVFTSHALEPNHGKEKILLEELFRITRKCLVLIEPTYELGSKLTQKHIKKHGYVRNLPNIIKKLGHNVVEYKYLKQVSKYNEDALIVAEKSNQKFKNKHTSTYVSPISLRPLIQKKNYLYCKDDGFVFPIIDGIPCLLKSNGIICSKSHMF